MIKVKFPNETNTQETNSVVSSRAVQEQIGQIRRGKVMSFIRKAQEEGVGMFENATAGVANMWEGARDHRRWLIDNGSTAGFDTKISKLDTHAESIQEKMQREARRFDELAAKFEGGTMNLRDIERNKRAHLVEFEERLEKIKQEREKIQAEKEAKEKEIQELKNRINDRITTGINKVKIETNLDYNLDQQGKLKEQIDKGTKSLAENKKAHAELTEKCKVMFGTGWRRLTREAISHITYGAVSETRSEDNALKDLTDKEKKGLTPDQIEAAKKAKSGIKKDMEDKRMSFENLAVEIKAAMERHAVEIERLEANLEKLQAAKDEVDPLVIKGQSRIAKWEAKRASYGIEHKIDGLKDDSENVGEHVLVKGFDNAKDSVDSVEKMIGTDRTEWEAKIHSPEFLFSKGSNFNFKVSGFETVVQPAQISEALLTIRKETDSKIFDLENTVTKLKSTIDSGTVKKKEEVDDLKKQIERAGEMIADLKISLLNRIPVDENGQIDKKIDQKALLLELCPNVNITSDEKEKVFGNKLETNDEKKAGLETLQAAIAEIDAIPEPVTRLKAYSKTIAFGLDNKLRLSLDQTAIDEIYNSIVNEKIPALFSQISDPKVAVEEGISAIELLAEAGSSPVSSERMIQSITEGICKNIENTTSADDAGASFLLFAEKFSDLDGSVSSIAYPRTTVDQLLAVRLGEVVIKKIRDEQDIYSASRKAADLVCNLYLITGKKLNQGYIKRLFTEVVDHLEMKPSEIEVDNQTNNFDDNSSAAIYEETYKYVEQKMLDSGISRAKNLDNQKTQDQVSAEIKELKQKGNPYELAQYAAELAEDNSHQKEALEAIGFAQLYCNNDARTLRIIGDIFSNVEGKTYLDKTIEIYDAAFEALLTKSSEPVTSYMYLMDSLNQIKYDDKTLAVAEAAVDIMSAGSAGGNDSLYTLRMFMDTCDRIKPSPISGDLTDLTLKISKETFENISNTNTNKDTVVSLLTLLEEHGFTDDASEMFSNLVQKISKDDALDFIKHFRNQANHSSPFSIKGELTNETREQCVDQLVDKVIDSSRESDLESKVKNLVTLYRELSDGDFAERANVLFEGNLDLQDQENVVKLIDVLFDPENGPIANGQDLIETYAEEAIKMSEGDLEGLTNLMTHWADLDNNMYMDALAKVRKLSNGDYSKLMNLAEIMDKHEIDLGLQITLEEAEQIAKQNLESRGFEVDTGFTELERVAEMYEKIKGLDGEGRRLRKEIRMMKNEPIEGDDFDESLNVDDLNEHVFVSSGPEDTDFTGRSTEGRFPGSAGREDKNAGMLANNSKKKKGGFFSNFFSGFFGSGNDKK